MSANPGCFGAAITHNPSSDACRNCVAFEPCGVASRESLDRLSKIIPARVSAFNAAREKKGKAAGSASALITASERASEYASSTPPKDAAERNTERPAEMPKKARELMESLERKGVILGALREGVNPVMGMTPVYLDLALSILLREGFDKPSLRAAFITNFKWGDATALSHVGIVIGLLRPLGLIVEKDGRFYIA